VVWEKCRPHGGPPDRLPPRRVDLVLLSVCTRAGRGTAAPPCRDPRAQCTTACVLRPGPNGTCWRRESVAACGTGLARARPRRSCHGWQFLRPSGGQTRVGSLRRLTSERGCKRLQGRGAVFFGLALCGALCPDDAAPRPARGAQGTRQATGHRHWFSVMGNC